jgi:hypothetical protein
MSKSRTGFADTLIVSKSACARHADLEVLIDFGLQLDLTFFALLILRSGTSLNRC